MRISAKACENTVMELTVSRDSNNDRVSIMTISAKTCENTVMEFTISCDALTKVKCR